MCGLKQEGEITYDDLKQHLLPHGHVPTKHTPALWCHASSNLTFTLIADDFGIKCKNISQFQHLLHTLQQKYDIAVNSTDTLCAKVSLDWNYVNRIFKFSTTGCIKKVLTKHNNLTPTSEQHNPRQPEPITYVPHQPPTPNDNSKDLTKEEKLVFQSTLGSLLCYGHIIDSTILTAINDLSIVQTKATTASNRHLNTSLDNFHSNANATMLHRKSDMMINVRSDGSHLLV